MTKESEWVDYGMLLDEIHLHRSNAQRQINEYREKGKERDLTKSEYGLYNEEVGKEIALMCLERWCMDFKFSISEIKEMEVIQEDKKLPENREEAAENYIAPIENDEGLDYINFNGRDIKDAFIAGAEWQYQKDRYEFAKIKTKTWCEGFDDCKKQMMEDAVEIEVVEDAGGFPIVPLDAIELYDYENDKPLAKAGDKVRVIVIKED